MYVCRSSVFYAMKRVYCRDLIQCLSVIFLIKIKPFFEPSTICSSICVRVLHSPHLVPGDPPSPAHMLHNVSKESSTVVEQQQQPTHYK